MKSFLLALTVSDGIWAGFGLSFAAETAGASGVAEPATVWDLTDLFASPEAWTAERDRVAAALPGLGAYAGTLGQGPEQLQAFLDAYDGLAKDLSRLGVYASLKAHEDLRDATNLQRRTLSSQLGNAFNRITSFYEPEVLAIGDDTVLGWLEPESGLSPYRFPLLKVLRDRPHTLGAEAEGVLAASSLTTGTGGQVHGILTNADFPWPAVTLTTGETVTLNAAGYAKHRAAPNREDRKLVFDAFWTAYRTYENTFGTTFNGMVQTNLFEARAHHHASSLAAALSPHRVPEAVYHTLLAEVNASLPTLHRYFRLRGRLLGIDQPRYDDIYPDLVTLDQAFPIADGRRLTVAAVAPLGPDYVAGITEALNAPWTHLYPAPGKRAGAYMSGSAYDVHPYVLMNYQDTPDSVSTLAHEWGHGMHAQLANAAQPYPTARYSIFTAEIASVVNEVLLMENMLREARTDDERLYYLAAALEGMRGTYFRQAMFAEFELRAHEIVGQGGALSGKRLTALYGDLLKRYHGDTEGALKIDDLYAIEWAYLPHFYRGFYVYQYATSLAAANLFADRILAGEPGAVEAYLGLLAAGGADDGYQLVRRAGVDLASPAPYQATARRMEAIMDRVEAILANRAP